MPINVTKIMTNRGITRTPQQLTSRHDDLAVLLGVSNKVDEFVPKSKKTWKSWIYARLSNRIDELVDKAFNIRHFDIK